MNRKVYHVTIQLHEDDDKLWNHIFDSRKEAVDFVVRCITKYYCYEVKFEERTYIEE